MQFDLTKCRVCPRKCSADRTRGLGACGADSKIRIAKIMLHRWEEPCISGTDEKRGSGAVFFGGCPLKCVFCQNKAISRSTAEMKAYTPKELSLEFRHLEEMGAYNINLVSPTQYIPQIKEALSLYRPTVPVIFNTGGYELREAVEALRGYADIFLTDFKYGTNEAGKKYSAVSDYTTVAKEALSAMVSVVGEPRFSEDGMLLSGVIVRHLILPGERRDSIKALSEVANTVPSNSVILSLMRQYTPDFAPDMIPSLKRRITTFEYDTVCAEAISLGFSGYSQDADSAKSQYTPDF